ncbi:MAG: hypothetical protein DRJ32_03365 [Thermoprotei archaeon]|nr:MAG: hypothetical protein DRJ32_03365 [Thermoprotei archaeon]
MSGIGVRYFDIAARIACLARTRGKFDKAQVNKLIEVLEASPEKEAIQYLTAFISRQSSKGLINRDAARELTRFFFSLSNVKNPKEEARKFLGIFKWLYEAAERAYLRNVNCGKLTYEQFIRIVLGLG